MTSGTTTTSKRNYLDYTALPETKASQYRLTQPTQKHTPQTLQELQQLTAIMQAADISGAQDIHVGMIQQILVKAVLLNSKAMQPPALFGWIWKSKCSNKTKESTCGQSEHEKYTCVLVCQNGKEETAFHLFLSKCPFSTTFAGKTLV
jgi:hypothetical protein